MPFPSIFPLNPLGVILTKLLEARQLSDSDFARKAGLARAQVSEMKRRPASRLPRRVELDRWIRLLALSKEEAAQLREAAELTWSPQGIQELVSKLRDEKRQ